MPKSRKELQEVTHSALWLRRLRLLWLLLLLLQPRQILRLSPPRLKAHPLHLQRSLQHRKIEQMFVSFPYLGLD